MQTDILCMYSYIYIYYTVYNMQNIYTRAYTYYFRTNLHHTYARLPASFCIKLCKIHTHTHAQRDICAEYIHTHIHIHAHSGRHIQVHFKAKQKLLRMRAAPWRLWEMMRRVLMWQCQQLTQIADTCTHSHTHTYIHSCRSYECSCCFCTQRSSPVSAFVSNEMHKVFPHTYVCEVCV